jgi:zinc/manganese transport system permease protein
MAAPFVACVVLVGIHAYLGMHVIQRKVIFVDLALAQIAALGAIFAFIVGLSPHSPSAYFFSLGFAVAGAAIFALTRMRHERIPQEAIIGIVYAVALALAILVAARAPEGAEHIQETLVGTILWVSWPTIVSMAVLYAVIGTIHVALRKRFFQISFHPDEAYAEKRWIRFWDFLFYVTFALVITSSVAVAGVLLVFSFLVIPAVIATLFATKISTRLAIGWTVGIAACLIGLVASYRFDLPSGPAVVASLGSTLVLAALLYYVMAAEHKAHAVLKAAAGVALVAGTVISLTVFFTSGKFLHIEHEHDWEHEGNHAATPDAEEPGLWEELSRTCSHDPKCEATRLAEEHHDDWIEHCSRRLGSPDPAAREQAVKVLGAMGGPAAIDLLVTAALEETDPLLRLEEATIVATAGDTRGRQALVGLLNDEIPPLVRDEAHELLLEISGEDFGYDPFAGADDNLGAIERWKQWASTG